MFPAAWCGPAAVPPCHKVRRLRNPDDSRSQSFQNLFPSNHSYYGFMDELGWRNPHDARLSLSARPARTLTVTRDEV
jgi:hypothetical protein